MFIKKFQLIFVQVLVLVLIITIGIIEVDGSAKKPAYIGGRPKHYCPSGYKKSLGGKCIKL